MTTSTVETVSRVVSTTGELVKVNSGHTGTTLLLACLAGLCFGIWPYYLKRAEINGLDSAIAFGMTQAAVLLCFGAVFWSIRGETTLLAAWALVIALGIVLLASHIWGSGPRLGAIVAACILSAVGLLAFTHMMGFTTMETRGPYFVMVFGLQVAISVAYHLYNSKENISLWQWAGYATIVFGVICLHKK